MTETTACCGRCSRTIEDTPIGVSVDGGPLCIQPTPCCASARNVRHPWPDVWSEIVAMVQPRVGMRKPEFGMNLMR